MQQTLTHIFNTIVVGIRRDMRVRWGLGAGASVLLSAGVLGMGGTIGPNFLHASSSLAPAVAWTQERSAQGIEIVDMSTTTVAQVIAALPKAARYELMAYNAGLQDALNHAGTITVFVPASAEFDYLPRGYIAGLTRTETRQLALRHVVERALPMQESLSGTIITAARTALTFEVDAGAGEVAIGDAKVLKAYKAKNGWVYLIDKVLVPAD